MLGCNHSFGCSLFSQRDAFSKRIQAELPRLMMSLNLIRLYFRQNNHINGIFSPTLMTAHHRRHSHCTVLLPNGRARTIYKSRCTRQHSQSLSKRLCLYSLWLYFCFMFFFHFLCVPSSFLLPFHSERIRSFGVERFCLADSCSDFSVFAMFGRYLQHVSCMLFLFRWFSHSAFNVFN